MQVTSPDGRETGMGQILAKPLDPRMATSGALIANTLQASAEMTQTMQTSATGKGANLNIQA